MPENGARKNNYYLNIEKRPPVHWGSFFMGKNFGSRYPGFREVGTRLPDRFFKKRACRYGKPFIYNRNLIISERCV